MKIFKILVKRFLLPVYWIIRNYRDSTYNYNLHLSPKIKLGYKSMIRKNTEIYSIDLGDYSYVSGPNTYVEDAYIGKYCSIARNVVIGVSDHNYKWVTTSPIITSQKYKLIKKNILEKQKPIPVIGNDVWIGMNSIIMRGVKIGDGAVVAAGSVVTKNIQPYSIVGGVPAKLIKHRYSKDEIKTLLTIKWWDWDKHKIKSNLSLFYDIKKFIKIHKP